MYNYIRSNPLPKKPDSDATCIYPETNIPPTTMPPVPMPPVPMPMPPSTMPPVPMPMTPSTMPCHQCTQCMHYNNCMQVPSMPCSPSYNKVPDPYCDMSKNNDDMEVAYLKKMYSPVCQKIQKYVEAELNQYDHDLSPIYEMYPSTETIDHMANSIYTDMKAAMPSLIKGFECNTNTRSPIGGSFYTLIYALLLNELYRKRMRRRLYR